MTKIRSTLEFADALSTLLRDESFPSENADTRSFIEAMQAWLKDVDGKNSWFEDPNDDYITWSDLFELLQASATYE